MTPEERAQKKIIIGGIWLMFAAVLLGIFVLLIPWRCILPWMCRPPSPPPVEIKNLEVAWSALVPRADGALDLVGAVTNPNSTHGARLLDYTFKVFDTSGAPLRDVKGTTYILPNDKERFIVELNHRFLSQPTRAELVLTQPTKSQWEQLKGFSGPNLRTLADVISVVSREASYVRVKTTAINGSGITFDKVDIVALAFGQTNDVVGVGETSVGTLNPQEPRDAQIDIVTRSGASVSRVRTGIYTNIFLNENLLRRYRGTQPYDGYQ